MQRLACGLDGGQGIAGGRTRRAGSFVLPKRSKMISTATTPRAATGLLPDERWKPGSVQPEKDACIPS